MSFSPLGFTALLGVFDMPKALAFYKDILGFTVASAAPEVETAEGRFSHWIWLRSGEAEMCHLRGQPQLCSYVPVSDS